MGIVLVFDLDQTILDTSDDRLFDGSLGPDEIRELIKKNLNMNIVNLLIRTSELRPSGKVTAICLLTNNSSVKFVQLVDGVLKELTKSNGSYGKKAVEDGFEAGEYFFDAIMTRNHSARPIAASGSPPKRIEDINKMLEPFSTSFGSATMGELFFFDDVPNHQILQTYKEVGDFKENYIQIKPPYDKYTRDTTNYTPILRALSELDGGAPTLPEPPPPQKPSQMAPSMNSVSLQALINAAQKKRLGMSTAPRSQAPFRGTPALPAKARTVGRNRSNAKVNANNLGLPLSPPRSQSPPLSSMFQRKGGSRKTRRRRGGRRFTKRIR
ncbi:MAG: hypothetical protein EB127_23545 [Alphaproteobacteria bacterium]|nr:hypothetical protein [Alphaproteobacteria bacterium]